MPLSEKDKIFVAMSGGVDSSVAALILQEAGFDVVGVHIKCWSERNPVGGCSALRDEEDARAVAAQLKIPFYVWDFEEEYRSEVYGYFLKEYAEGRTPNPDVRCNKEIKFGVFLKRALALGAQYVATGHYARLDRIGGASRIYKAKDVSKDQSYFLWALAAADLRRIIFPLGEYLKREVRALAARAGLRTADKKDSQGLCFVGKVRLADVFAGRIPLTPGPIMSVGGERLGSHQGLAAYTIGQRGGLRIGGTGPYYVVEKNVVSNTLVVATPKEEESFKKSEVLLSGCNFFNQPPGAVFPCAVKTRYRQPDTAAEVTTGFDGRAKVFFETPQRALTPGQSVVFYQGDEMLGGGIIERAT